MPNTSALIDVGVNLTSSNFSHDRDAVLSRATDAGITQFVLIGSDAEDSHQALDLARRQNNLFCTAGIHPHHADTYSESALAEIRRLAIANLEKIKALGEMGLDYNRNFAATTNQRDAFAGQLQLAAELELPVYLHQRDAHQDFLEILSQYRPQVPRAVLHCFTGTIRELQSYNELDLYYGITGWICDERRGLHLQESVKHIPLDRLMIETDAPYLLPRTILPRPKSRRNEPSNLIYVLEKLAHCLDIDPQELGRITTQNARRFFEL